MNAIIDGKRYDTNAAEAIASFENGVDHGNWHYYEEGLFRTAKGNWFLAGEGNGLSPYAETYAGGWSCAGSAIRPLTAEEARLWLEAHGEVQALERFFGDEIQDA